MLCLDVELDEIAEGRDVILADEATGNLDSKSGKEILDLFDELNQQGKTLVFVTHDERMVQRCTRIIRLRDGDVVGGPLLDLLESALAARTGAWLELRLHDRRSRSINCAPSSRSISCTARLSAGCAMPSAAAASGMGRPTQPQ